MASLNSGFAAKTFPNSIYALRELYDGKSKPTGKSTWITT